MATQYVACRFKANDKRTYTYSNDGPPVRPGDRVKVEDARGGGWKPVEVVSVGHDKPPFPTKPILGKVEGADVDKAILDKGAKGDKAFTDYVEQTRSGLAGPDMFDD